MQSKIVRRTNDTQTLKMYAFDKIRSFNIKSSDKTNISQNIEIIKKLPNFKIPDYRNKNSNEYIWGRFETL